MITAVDYALVAVGLAILVAGAEFVVRGGSAIATRLRIPPMVIGLTVVSIGTSLPELAIGIDAAINDAGELAIGNIAGTNIVNLLLILGLSAAMLPLVIDGRTIRFELPVIAGVSVLLVMLAIDGRLSRADALLLLAIGVVYTIRVVILALRDSAAAEPDEPPATTEPPLVGSIAPRDSATTGSTSTELDLPTAPIQPPLTGNLALLVLGLVIVVIGADWLVHGAVGLATALGVSEVIIGLTVVAIGSSAPELVTTLVSTIRGSGTLRSAI